MSTRIRTSILLGLIFLIFGLMTLPHYGTNWDTINHLPRGQAYLNYFLTGNKNYSNLPSSYFKIESNNKYYQQNPKNLLLDAVEGNSNINRRSLYQNNATTFDWYMEYDGRGHPPLSDILSSVFNKILYQELGLINDIDSYRVYGLFLAAALIGLVFWWTSKEYGYFAGIVSALVLGLYPLFWSESHFNTEKDIPETVFLAFMYFAIWKGVTTRSWKWIFSAGLFMGLALGTKFNVLFSIFVFGPWLLAYLTRGYIKAKINIGKFIIKNKKLLLASILSPILALFIFIASWPYLWPDVIERIGQVIFFYQEIGLTSNVNPDFLGPFGVNTYSIRWIIYTTPIITLGLFALGFIKVIRRSFKESMSSLIFILWFLVPIARVSWPGTNIYGGVRQIMEYIPAMAIIAGAGASVVMKFVTTRFSVSKKIVGLIVVLGFIPITYKMIMIHPNESAYFNELIGGLEGAKDKEIPSWGTTFGGAYREGINWINDNAEPNSDLVTAFELTPNIPAVFVRSDLNFNNKNRSGSSRIGEYAITLTHQGTSDRSYYDLYLETILEPAFESKVDGVSVMKVWINDLQHTRNQFLNEELIEKLEVIETDDGYRVDLKEVYSLSRIETKFNQYGCEPLSLGYSQISKDGKNWERLPGNLPEQNWNTSAYGFQPSDGEFIQPFAANSARYIDYSLSTVDSCFSQLRSIEVYFFPDNLASTK